MGDAKKIIIIDDDPQIVLFLTTLLEDHGYATISAVDGVDGLEKVKADKPDLILLDITMPEKSGVRFYRDVRDDEALKEIPVIMVTGIMEEFKRFISSRKQVPPPDGYFSKPVDKDALLAKLEEVLG